VQISINTIVRVDVQLQVGAVSENITVNSSASVLQTDRADVNQQIGSAPDTGPAATRHAQLPGAAETGARHYTAPHQTIPTSRIRRDRWW